MNEWSEVIVLKNSDYREADAILDVLSAEYGKITFVARGIRKPKSKNANSCNLFCYSRFQYDKKSNTIQNLKVAETIKSFRKIHEDLYKQSIASVMVEVMNKIEVEDSEASFYLLKTSLTYLETTDNALCLLGLFFAKVCSMSGISPYVDGCVLCGTSKNIATISLIDGGFVCSSCMHACGYGKKEVSTLKFFRLFNKASIDDFPALEAQKPCNYRDIEDIIMLFLEYSGVNIQSIKFLQHLLAM